MSKLSPIFPQLTFTSPEWGKKVISGSKQPIVTTLEDSIRLPVDRIVNEYLAHQIPEQTKKSDYADFIESTLLTCLFALQGSKFKPGDFNALRMIGSQLPDAAQEQNNWERVIDKISQRLNEPEMKTYSLFDKFKLTVAMLNELFLSKKDAMLFRAAGEFTEPLTYFNLLATANPVGQLHYAPLRRPLNAYFLSSIPKQFHETKSRYEATGNISTNLDMIAVELNTIWQGGQVAIPQNAVLQEIKISPEMYRAANETERVLQSRHNNATSFLPISAEDSLLQALSAATLHTEVEINAGRQIITLNEAFYTNFAETQLENGGLLKDIYRYHKQSSSMRQFDPILEYAIFHLACSLKRGQYSREPNITLYGWVNHLLPLPGHSKFNVPASFYSKLGIQLLSDELQITNNSLSVGNYNKFEKTELSNQAIQIANKLPNEVSMAMEKIYAREFKKQVHESTFASYNV